MVDCVSVRNMRISDQNTIKSGISGKELIRRAALGIYHSVEWNGKVAVVTGSGNNGADGFALADILQSRGVNVSVFKVSDHLHDDCTFYALKAEKNGVPIYAYKSGGNLLTDYNIIVDCLLGTGFQGKLRANYRSAIDEINETDAYIVSVDINSGMNGDTGKGSAVVRSDLTIAIEFIKQGMVVPCVEEYMGRLVCVSIGIQLAEQEGKICNDREWRSLCDKLSVLEEVRCVEADGVMYYKCPPWIDINI